MASWGGGHSGSGEGAHRTDECHRHSRQKIHLRKAVRARNGGSVRGMETFPWKLAGQRGGRRDEEEGRGGAEGMEKGRRER